MKSRCAGPACGSQRREIAVKSSQGNAWEEHLKVDGACFCGHAGLPGRETD
jgi:hypothetical protein